WSDRGSPQHFSPSSVQRKSEINGACLCKRHQKRHLEFCTAYLLSRMLWVRIPPGAPLPFNDSCENAIIVLMKCKWPPRVGGEFAGPFFVQPRFSPVTSTFPRTGTWH